MPSPQTIQKNQFGTHVEAGPSSIPPSAPNGAPSTRPRTSPNNLRPFVTKEILKNLLENSARSLTGHVGTTKLNKIISERSYPPTSKRNSNVRVPSPPSWTFATKSLKLGGSTNTTKPNPTEHPLPLTTQNLLLHGLNFPPLSKGIAETTTGTEIEEEGKTSHGTTLFPYLRRLISNIKGTQGDINHAAVLLDLTRRLKSATSYEQMVNASSANRVGTLQEIVQWALEGCDPCQGETLEVLIQGLAKQAQQLSKEKGKKKETTPTIEIQ